MKRAICAYAFDSALSLSDLRTRLNELGPWLWVDRDSDRYGEYVCARARLRITVR